MSLKERAVKLKSDIPAVFIALSDKETPWFAKALCSVTIAYALSPIDLVPDFIPLFGYLDDLIILPILVAITVKCIPKEVWSRSRIKAEGLWQNGKPKRWYYAIPIILFWAIVLILIIRLICS